MLNRHRSRHVVPMTCLKRCKNTLTTPAEGLDNPISRSDPSAGVKEVVNLLLHTGRLGLTPLRPVPI